MAMNQDVQLPGSRSSHLAHHVRRSNEQARSRNPIASSRGQEPLPADQQPTNQRDPPPAFQVSRPVRPTPSCAGRPRVLIVAFAIPKGMLPLVRRSQEACVARHGYDFREVRDYVGRASRGRVLRAASLHKLLACTLARGHELVLVKNSDVLLAPWAPPIHPVGRALGAPVGIVDEHQPRMDTGFKVKRYLYARTLKRPVHILQMSSVQCYFRTRGFPGKAPGILNTGFMLMQPAVHGKFLEDLYYKYLDRQIASKFFFRYERAMLTRQLINRDMYARLPHAWNRLWVFYSFSGRIGERPYSREEVFRGSYFMHCCSIKPDLKNFIKVLIEKNFSFSPQPYATDVLP